jgi:hypothetical protein
MTPVDYRNATFAELQDRGLEGLRGHVLKAWQAHGPCTTEELAEKSGISILTLRPRTTELVQIGLVVLSEAIVRRGGGIYRAATTHEALYHFQAERARASGANAQPELALGLTPPPSRYY